jgi:KipI family sensor histidine kinase inhibitor
MTHGDGPPVTTSGVRILPYGPGALLAEYDDLDTVLSVASRVRALGLPGVVDVVAAFRTVLVVHDGADRDALVAALSDVRVEVPEPGALVTIPVRYDGPDLAEVAAATQRTEAEVVAAHTAAEYRVAFCGFVPGFAYLVGLPAALHLPRRGTPRTRVPAGSVAIAAEFSAVYPAATPGGWHLLGRTDLPMWDDSLAEPALLAPGMRVRFEAR